MIAFIRSLEVGRATSVEWEHLTLNCCGEHPEEILGLYGLRELTYRGDNESAYERLFEKLLTQQSSKAAAASGVPSLERLKLSVGHFLSERPDLVRPSAFFDLLSDFLKKRGLQKSSSPLYLTLSIDSREYPILQDISEEYSNESLVLRFEQDTPLSQNILDTEIESFADKWKPVWWKKISEA